MTPSIKNCPVCRGRGKVYEGDPDSLGRHVRRYRCDSNRRWKSVEIPYSPETPQQKAAMVMKRTADPVLLDALRKIKVSLIQGSSLKDIRAIVDKAMGGLTV